MKYLYTECISNIDVIFAEVGLLPTFENLWTYKKNKGKIRVKLT